MGRYYHHHNRFQFETQQRFLPPATVIAERYVSFLLSMGGVYSSMQWEGGVSQHAMGQGGGRHPPWTDHPRQISHPLRETATEAGGTHPTGMHSCHIVVSVLKTTVTVEITDTFCVRAYYM